MVHNDKSVVFGSSLSLLPLVSEGGGLTCESVGKAVLLSDHFGSKQFRKAVNLLLTCHPSPSLTTFAFRSSEVSRFLSDLDPYRGNDSLGMLPLLKMMLLPQSFVWCFGGLFVWVVSGLLETGQCHSNSDRSTVLLCCQLPTDFHNISIV